MPTAECRAIPLAAEMLHYRRFIVTFFLLLFFLFRWAHFSISPPELHKLCTTTTVAIKLEIYVYLPFPYFVPDFQEYHFTWLAERQPPKHRKWDRDGPYRVSADGLNVQGWEGRSCAGGTL